MGLILSIFSPRILVLIPLLSLILVMGCSSKRLATPTQSADVVRAPIEAGPTGDPQTFTFVDRTADYGLEGVEGVRFYAVDLNNNGFTDLVVLPDFYSIPDFYYFDPKTKKFIQDEDAQIAEGLRASFLGFYDLDRDGVLDVVVATLNQHNALTPVGLLFFKGSLDNGRIQFTPVPDALNAPPGPVASLTFLDYDLDGQLDLFVGHWFDMTQERRPPIADRLFRGEGLKFHEDSARLVGEREFDRGLNTFVNARPTFASTLCDVDLNGYPDILTSSSAGHPNKMWLNLSGGARPGRLFRDYGAETGYSEDDLGKFQPLGGGFSFFSVCTDYNNNGLVDILMGELAHPYESESRDRSSFLTGSRFEFPPQFIRTEYHYDLEEPRTQSDQRGIFVDLNRDGLIDIIVDNSGFPPSTRLISFIQNSDHSFEDKAEFLGLNIVNPAGTIVLDVNRDGRMDLLTGQLSTRDSRIQNRVYLFENVTPLDENRSLRLYLRGEKANPVGIGARVIVETELMRQMRFVSLQEGPQSSQNEEGLLFGLGESKKIKKVRVVWPYLQDGEVLERTYELGIDLKGHHQEFTLCDNGRSSLGRKKSCR
jgi:enediyne biosynthesis protein E4